MSWIKSLLAHEWGGEEGCEAGLRRWDAQRSLCNDQGPCSHRVFLPFSLFLKQKAVMHHILLNTWTPEFRTPLLTLGHWWPRTTRHGRVMPPSPWLPRHLIRMAVPSPEEVTRQGWPREQLSDSQKLKDSGKLSHCSVPQFPRLSSGLYFRARSCSVGSQTPLPVQHPPPPLHH